MTELRAKAQNWQEIHRTAGRVLYRARLDDGAPVLIKRYLEGSGVEPWERANRESEAIRHLRLPCTPELIDLTEHNLQPCLVLSDPGGALLSSFAAGWPASQEWALAGLLSISTALGQFERAGFCHRFLCPESILYNPHSGRVTLLDLEQTASDKLETAPLDLSSLNMAYASPELCGSKSRRLERRSDLYSLGLIAFEMLTGRKPFEESDPIKLLHCHLAVLPVPPSALVPAISPEVDELVLKLLEKEPLARLQSAASLQSRVGQILCRAFGVETDQENTESSIERSFALKEKLYGRRAEMRELREAYAQATGGCLQTVLLGGAPGVGKTSLVNALVSAEGVENLYFAVGKFEQLGRDIPYAAVIHAIDALLQKMQTESDSALQTWQQRVRSICPEELGLLTGVLPRLGQLLALKSGLPNLKESSLQPMYLRAFNSLISSFARGNRPLVIFLDDIQWADPASINLLLQIAGSQDTEAMLFILAYRDEESQASTLIEQTLERLMQCCRPRKIHLQALSPEQVTALVSDALMRSPEGVRELSRKIHSKTEGNPLFVRRFLTSLQQEGYIRYNPSSDSFEVGAGGIDALAITDNVAELLKKSMHKLGRQTMQALAYAGAIGSRFSSSLLARVLQMPIETVESTLEPAVRGGWISEMSHPADLSKDKQYTFQHDKIQEAAYAAIREEKLSELHLTLGRLLLNSLEPDEKRLRLFEILGHLNLAQDMLCRQTEKSLVCELNLEAGHKASSSAAFEIAAGHYRHALSLADWSTDPNQAFRAHSSLAQATLLSGSPRQAVELIDKCLQRPLNALQICTLQVLALRSFVALGDADAAIERARIGAAQLGVRLPSDSEQIGALTATRTSQVMTWLQAGPCERILKLKTVSDPKILILFRLLTEAIPPTYMRAPNLMALCSAKQLALTLEHGLSADTPRIVLNFCVLLARSGERQLCSNLAEIALKIDQDRPELERDPINRFIVGSFISPWSEPASKGMRHFDACFHASLETGQKEHAAWCTFQGVIHQLFQGAPLPSVWSVATARAERAKRLEIGPLVHLILATEALGEALLHGGSWRTLKQERESFEQIVKVGNKSLEGILQTMRLVRTFLLEDCRQAAQVARESKSTVEWNKGMISTALHAFFAQLCFTRCTEISRPGLDELQSTICWFETEAQHCPANFLCKVELLKAEQCRLNGDALNAMKHYDNSIEEARRARCCLVEALACELAANHWQDLGKMDFAVGYLRKARNAFAKWGCSPKVHQLERIYPGAFELVGAGTQVSQAPSVQYETLIRGSQILSGELELTKLLGLMSQTIVQTTGAQSGVIVLKADNEWRVVSSCRGDDKPQTFSAENSLEQSRELPVSVAHYVARSGSQLLLEDAASSHLFSSDPYVVAHRPRSVLCSPITRGSKLIGLIYLENRVYSGAFTSSTSEALGFLASQMAVSIENARLYETARHQTRELERTAEKLEEMVKARTRELVEANQQLMEESQARSRMESELRLAQKLQAVGQLAAGIAHEINTPLQYVGDNLQFLGDAFQDIMPLINALLEDTPDIGALKLSLEDIDLEFLCEEIPDALSNSQSGVNKVSHIVKAMRNTSHHDLGNKSAVDLNQLIRDSLLLTQSEYKMLAEVEQDFAELPSLQAFSGALSQVFINLIVNASHAMADKYSDSSGLGRLRVSTACEGDWLVARVSDNGVGIPEDKREQIFDPFFTTKDVGQGTGQGLSIARSAVEQHGGELSFESQVGVGTTFIVRLPLNSEEVAA